MKFNGYLVKIYAYFRKYTPFLELCFKYIQNRESYILTSAITAEATTVMNAFAFIYPKYPPHPITYDLQQENIVLPLLINTIQRQFAMEKSTYRVLKMKLIVDIFVCKRNVKM